MLIKYHNKCRICNNEKLREIIDLGDHYLHGSFVFKDYHPPIRKIPAKLMFCSPEDGGCSLVQLAHSLDSSILYDKYGYRSSINEKMRNHLKSVVDSLLTICPNPQKVMDIASNDNYLLSCYPDDILKVGVDPCDAGINSEIKVQNLKFINECYPTNKISPEEKFDIISCLSMFYDLNNPIFVAKQIKKNLLENGILLIEVSYWPDKMKNNAVDELCEEHCVYYSLSTLKEVFNTAGFRIFRVFKNDINGGSIQIWMTHSESNLYKNEGWSKQIKRIEIEEFDLALDTPKPYIEFVERIETNKRLITDFIKQEAQKGKKIHLLGASTKSNVALQYWGLNNSQIPYASERNKEKWGGKTLGTNIQMISEEESKAMNPDYYLCLIWGFREQVLIREKDYIMNGGNIIFCIPNLEIVNQENYEQHINL